MKYQHKKDAWEVDGLRERLFGNKTLSVKICEGSHDKWLRLRISSKSEFNYFSSNEVKDVSDHMSIKHGEGDHWVNYLLTIKKKDFLTAREFLQDILAINKRFGVGNDSSQIGYIPMKK